MHALSRLYRTLLSVCFTLALVPAAFGQTGVPINSDFAPADRERIEAALDQRGSVNFVDTPLTEVAERLSLRFGIPVHLSPKKLEEAAVAVDTPVTFRADDLPLESILTLILRELELDWAPRDNVLMITTPDDLNSPSNLETRLYPVLDLITPRRVTANDPIDSSLEYEALINLITTAITPTDWDEVGGSGSITYLDNTASLVISQTYQTHRKIERLLATVRQVKAQQGLGGAPAAATARTGSAAPIPSPIAPRRYTAAPSQPWMVPLLHPSE